MTLCAWLLTTSGPVLAPSHQTPLLGTLRCFSGLTSTDDVKVVLTSTYLTPWCCLVNICIPWIHNSSTHSVAFAQNQSICWGAMTPGEHWDGRWSFSTQYAYVLRCLPPVSTKQRKLPFPLSHTLVIAQLYVCFRFLLRMAFACCPPSSLPFPPQASAPNAPLKL